MAVLELTVGRPRDPKRKRARDRSIGVNEGQPHASQLNKLRGPSGGSSKHHHGCGSDRLLSGPLKIGISITTRWQ